MKKLLKLVVGRWLARTPLGLVALALGWYLARRRRRREAERTWSAASASPTTPGPEGRPSRAGSQQQYAAKDSR
ncbi:DUF6203 family protein [Nonomuraea jiangxiensis]|uniref:DUF6203 family protein n=1 Tax=Nonomuraea jiangxiensis TaxID=633440 RepID=UPI00115FCED1